MAEHYRVTYILPDGTERDVLAAAGENLLELAHRHHIALEGACECALACSTCHVIIDPVWFKQLPPAVDKEEDLLDYAFGLTTTSRLGCQIKMHAGLDGLRVRIPAATRNMMVDQQEG